VRPSRESARGRYQRSKWRITRFFVARFSISGIRYSSAGGGLECEGARSRADEVPAYTARRRVSPRGAWFGGVGADRNGRISGRGKIDLKVLLVHNRYRSSSPSGEDRVVDQEAKALADVGCRVERFGRSNDVIADLGLAQRLMIPPRVAWNPGAARALGRVISDVAPDVVHFHNVYPLLSPSVLQACRDRVPAVVTFHNYRPLCPTGEMFRSGEPCNACVGRIPTAAVRHGCYRGSRLSTAPVALASLTQRRVWRSVPSAYIFLSHAQQGAFSSLGLPGDRCFVKGNLVVAPSPAADGPRAPIVAYVGRLDEAKGVRFLMEAWDRYREVDGDSALRLAVAGSGQLDPLVRAWADRHASVDVLGLLTRDGCAALMAKARSVVVPSVWEEPFGLVVAEAMAAGTPPIAPTHGSFPELIQDGVDGVLFPSGEPEALGRLFALVAKTPARFEQLGRAARATYSRRFTSEKNMTDLLAIYRFAIEHPVGLGAGTKAA
jgi:glycosyltransferase involved in cell wall biosynthesis